MDAVCIDMVIAVTLRAHGAIILIVIGPLSVCLETQQRSMLYYTQRLVRIPWDWEHSMIQQILSTGD